MASGARLRGPWPDSQQTWLLRAGLASDGHRAIEAWRRFGGNDALEPLDSGSHRLLPLAYRNLTSHGIEGAQLELLKGVYKHAWLRSQLQLRACGQALQALSAAGLETMVSTGAALGSCYYEDPGSRPLDDLDVMIPFARAADAISALRTAGWTPRDPRPERALLRHHGEPFQSPDGGQLELHWHLQWEAVDDASIWRASLPITVAGVTSRRLCPEDQLLHVCVHGSRSDPISPIRWIADAVLVLRRRGEEFEWDRLVEQASERQLTVTTGAALSYLRQAFDQPVPESVLRRLRQRSPSRTERWAHRARVTPGLPGRKVPIVWERYSKLARADGAEPRSVALVSFLQRLWELDSRRSVPVEVLRRTVRYGFSRGK